MKRWITLGAVAVVIAAMAVTIVLLRNRPPEERPFTSWADDPDRVELYYQPRDTIRRVVVTRPDGTLTIEDTGGGAFRPVYPYDVTFVSHRVDGVVSSATGLTSRRVIGEVDDLSEFGLDNPAAAVRIELAEGGPIELRIGGQNPARDSYYVQRVGDPAVYSVFSSWVDPYFSTLDQLRDRTIPQVNPQALRRVEVDTLAGRPIRASLRDEEERDPELGFSAFALTSPYQRHYQVNSNWLEELSTQLTTLTIERFVDDAPTNLARYGLNPPRARFRVADGDTTLEFLVGDQTEGGRYAKYPDQPSVFVLQGVESMVSVRPYDTVSSFVLILNIDLIDTFEVRAGNERFVGRIERTEVEGEEDPLETFYLNDRVMEDEPFRKLFQWAIGLLFDAEGATRTTGEPVATITYYLNDGSQPRSVSFVPENANFLSVVRDGRAEFVISRAKIQRMIAAFREAASAM